MEKASSRDLAAEVAQCFGKHPEDFARYMPVVQGWIRAHLFDAAGAGADEHNPRRGRSRRFPAEALRWARLFTALTTRGAGVVEMEHVAGVLHQYHQADVADALAGAEPDVWVIYAAADMSPPVADLHVLRGRVELPDWRQPSWAPVITAINLTRAFNP